MLILWENPKESPEKKLKLNEFLGEEEINKKNQDCIEKYESLDKQGS